MIYTILLFVLILSVLVFVHELGHFIVARKMGMRVDEFGFGFPPRLFSIKKNGTTYSLNWIPIGGFVRIKGEDGANRADHDSFASKKPWQRFLVLVAGVVMNFALAIILLSVGFMMGLPSVIEGTLPKGAHVEQSKLSVMQVLPDSPAARKGMVEGDVIVSFNTKVFATGDEARAYIAEHGKNGMDIVIEKKDRHFETIQVQSEPLKGTDKVGIGVAFVQTGLVSYGFFPAIGQGIMTTGRFTKEIFFTFGNMIKGLVMNQRVDGDLAGPIGIAVMTGQVASMGVVYLLQFAALLSINLAVINILPFPALDGGRIFFLMIEKLRRRSINERFETVTHNLGFLFLMVLIVLVTYGDVMRLFK